MIKNTLFLTENSLVRVWLHSHVKQDSDCVFSVIFLFYQNTIWISSDSAAVKAATAAPFGLYVVSCCPLQARFTAKMFSLDARGHVMNNTSSRPHSAHSLRWQTVKPWENYNNYFIVPVNSTFSNRDDDHQWTDSLIDLKILRLFLQSNTSLDLEQPEVNTALNVSTTFS